MNGQNRRESWHESQGNGKQTRSWNSRRRRQLAESVDRAPRQGQVRSACSSLRCRDTRKGTASHREAQMQRSRDSGKATLSNPACYGWKRRSQTACRARQPHRGTSRRRSARRDHDVPLREVVPAKSRDCREASCCPRTCPLTRPSQPARRHRRAPSRRPVPAGPVERVVRRQIHGLLFLLLCVEKLLRDSPPTVSFLAPNNEEAHVGGSTYIRRTPIYPGAMTIDVCQVATAFRSQCREGH